MTKHKGKRKQPSRERYEQKHPATTFRTDIEIKRQIDEHREKTGCSYVDLMLAGIEGDKSKAAEKRAEILALREIGLSDKERMSLIDWLVRKTLMFLWDLKIPAYCPRCGKGTLLIAWGYKKGFVGEEKYEIFTWKCPSCEWFLDIFGELDPESVGWD